MRDTVPLAPYARALRDHQRGATGATLTVHSSLGEHAELPVAFFFRGPEELLPFEATALALARGRVLDAGAGAGAHALALQRRGLAVTAVDILPEAVEVMRERGVGDARVADFLEPDESPGGSSGDPPLAGERFDTVLLLMNGIGPVGTLDGLDRFLGRAAELLRPGGQLLVDSGEALPEPGEDGWEWPAGGSGGGDRAPVGGAEDAGGSRGDDGGAGGGTRGSGEGPYPGEAWIRLEYRGEIGAPFRELYVDVDGFRDRARRAGWRVDLPFQDERGAFLARLTRPSGPTSPEGDPRP